MQNHASRAKESKGDFAQGKSLPENAEILNWSSSK